jgi:hypothetical protein
MSRDAYQKVQPMYAVGPDLPLLRHKDLYVETSVLGSEQVGQRNTQRSWIWGFGKTVDDEGTWMNDCKLYHHFYVHPLTHKTVDRVHWLRAKAQFERWLEEQDSIHNEAHWIPAYFHSKAEMWKNLMNIASQGSLKGHASYALKQMHAWEELCRSSTTAFSHITNASLKHYEVESILTS